MKAIIGGMALAAALAGAAAAQDERSAAGFTRLGGAYVALAYAAQPEAANPRLDLAGPQPPRTEDDDDRRGAEPQPVAARIAVNATPSDAPGVPASPAGAPPPR